MKKQRGQRRYYRNLTTQNDFEKLPWFSVTESDDYFDLWHIHMDWRGYGNNNFSKRRPHLDKLFRHFYILQNQIRTKITPYQIFIILLDQDSASDALYLHTPNPNKENFPYHIHHLQTTSTLTNIKLQAYIDEFKDFEKLYGLADEPYCLLYKKEFGHPFS